MVTFRLLLQFVSKYPNIASISKHTLPLIHYHVRNRRVKGQLPLACLIVLSSVYGWIRYFEMRELDYFKLEVAVIVNRLMTVLSVVVPNRLIILN